MKAVALVAAAELIRAQIRKMQYDCSHYPDTATFSNVESAKAWVPGLLMTSVETIIRNALKQTAVCHSIVQAAHLRSVCVCALSLHCYSELEYL